MMKHNTRPRSQEVVAVAAALTAVALAGCSSPDTSPAVRVRSDDVREIGRDIINLAITDYRTDLRRPAHQKLWDVHLVQESNTQSWIYGTTRPAGPNLSGSVWMEVSKAALEKRSVAVGSIEPYDVTEVAVHISSSPGGPDHFGWGFTANLAGDAWSSFMLQKCPLERNYASPELDAEESGVSKVSDAEFDVYAEKIMAAADATLGGEAATIDTYC